MQSPILVRHPAVVAVVMAVLVAIAAMAMSGVIATQPLRGLFLRV
jgi:hypothetical protein